ncbi:hypothetical protein CIK05_01270 [Bdellovibrio sp. qaytius]|nr:hypothetical protein CIK05_01270 [Bdellovibrio sp. qaytius]
MVKKVLLGLVVVLVIFLGYVSTREGKFHYERSAVINAPAEKIFPFISNFKFGTQWNPYDQKDPNMKRSFTGNDGEVGSVMNFDGNAESGSGKLEIVSLTPNSEAQIKLTMTKPIFAENMIIYTLKPEGEGTRFTWAMQGDGGFMGKLMNVFIDCEKMMTSEFEKGFTNLKAVIENK